MSRRGVGACFASMIKLRWRRLRCGRAAGSSGRTSKTEATLVCSLRPSPTSTVDVILPGQLIQTERRCAFQPRSASRPTSSAQVSGACQFAE